MLAKVAGGYPAGWEIIVSHGLLLSSYLYLRAQQVGSRCPPQEESEGDQYLKSWTQGAKHRRLEVSAMRMPDSRRFPIPRGTAQAARLCTNAAG